MTAASAKTSSSSSSSASSKDAPKKASSSTRKCKNKDCNCLYNASFLGHLECIKSYLASGSNIHETKTDGAKPLCIAAAKGHLEIVCLLLDRVAARASIAHINGTDYTRYSWALSMHGSSHHITQLLAQYS